MNKLVFTATNAYGEIVIFPYTRRGVTMDLLGPDRTVVSAPGVPGVVLPMTPQEAVNAIDGTAGEESAYLRDTLRRMRTLGKDKAKDW